MSDLYEDDDCGGSGCYNCGGSGWLVVCVDDLCRGAGKCMHGDGEEPCPVCNEGFEQRPLVIRAHAFGVIMPLAAHGCQPWIEEAQTNRTDRAQQVRHP